MKTNLFLFCISIGLLAQTSVSFADSQELTGRVRANFAPGTSNVVSVDFILEDECVYDVCNNFAAEYMYSALTKTEKSFSDPGQGISGFLKKGAKYTCFKFYAGADPLAHFACAATIQVTKGKLKGVKALNPESGSAPPIYGAALTASNWVYVTGILYRDTISDSLGRSKTVFSMGVNQNSAVLIYNALMIAQTTVPSDVPGYSSATRKSGKDFYCLKYASTVGKCILNFFGAQGKIRII